MLAVEVMRRAVVYPTVFLSLNFWYFVGSEDDLYCTMHMKDKLANTARVNEVYCGRSRDRSERSRCDPVWTVARIVVMLNFVFA